MKASNVIATQTEGQKSRVESTLFMLESADGKITSGANDNLDSDRDWKRIAGVKEGLHQYYKIEESIAFCCLNTGRVMEKIGINSRADVPHKDARLTFFLIDRRPHLNEKGINYLSQRLGKLFIVTDNSSHPAFTAQRSSDNVEVVFYQQGIDLPDLFRRIRQEYNFEKVVIQSGGTLNAQLLRQGLIDHVVIVVAPLLVGGMETSSLIDGPSFTTELELTGLKAMKLTRCEAMEHSYVRLHYDVINDTAIDPIA